MPENSPQSPAEQGSSADWRAQAAAAKLPVFPIRIFQDADGHWCKVPLIKGGHGHKDASYDVAKFDPHWPRANGYGIPMGSVATGIAFYALDLDQYAPGYAGDEWLDRWAVPRETRTVRTISGGFHLIFSLPAAFAGLRNRGDIVKGLQARGEGGWCAFGAGYELVLDVPPVLLPSGVCEALQRTPGLGHNGGPGLDGGELPELHPVDADDVMRRLGRILLGDHLPLSLEKAWTGTREESDGDTSKSGNDHALACSLALFDFSASEICYILLRQYPHGVAAKKGVNPTTIRAARRSAAKAVAYVKWLHTEPRKLSKEEAEDAAEEYSKWLREREGGA